MAVDRYGFGGGFGVVALAGLVVALLAVPAMRRLRSTSPADLVHSGAG